MKPGVRVTGGELRGRGLTVPPGARPTESRVREALFSIWGERIAGASFLDLFAGSGVVGIEARSRGARSVLAVDSEPRTLKVLEKNLAPLGVTGFAVRRLALPGGLARLAAEAGPFDLAFADPPYAFAEYGPLLGAIPPLLASAAELVIEHSSRTELPEEAGSLQRTDLRRYGESSLSFYRPRS
ncbi:MAG TPA: 16S rRNA (guanine(966)-N(2))-methyltransferase RsmD [Thermoanaerobaculia bacterium]|nr:16S rRNA (guanine(966)-N(2))-methyltransferase RsmD [Thermoanaerobaculia bacterium]